jgi:glucose-6-phosphate isomerase
MFISYFDDKRVTENAINGNIKKLAPYRASIADNATAGNEHVPEYSLYHCKEFTLHEELAALKKQFKGVTHVVLVGIGGSSLGVEAIHSVLDTGAVKLSVLDTVSAARLDSVIKSVVTEKKVKKIAVCVISKSGGTTETIANAAVLLDTLKEVYGVAIYEQTLFIGNPGTELLKYGKKQGAHIFTMPEVIGGRYCVATMAGLVPLTLLQHDVDDFIEGYLDALDERFESLVTESAARIAIYHKLKYHHYNFFAFEPRLEKVGRWYRQLFAESLGKETDLVGKTLTHAMVPTVSTAVELHSTGQLYMSGVPDTVTDFVTFDDEIVDMKIARANKMAVTLKGYTVQEVTTALYGGVVGAYQEKQLPYRSTIFEESLPYSLGLFMAMRLREVMYVANLLNVDAFNQPNVELYKTKTKEILSL